MSKKNFIEDCHAATSCTKAYCQNELNLFCEIMGLPKSKVNYFIGDDPHGVVDIMEGYYCFNMTDIHVVISEYEHWMEIYKTNEELRKEVDKWYYYCIDWYNQHSYEEPRWVSVDDRLPERMTSRDSNGAKIIDCCSKEVFGYDASYKIGRLVCYNHESEMWESHDAYTIGEITHWKPITTPEQEAERSKGCPNLRSWLAGCPVEGLRDATLEWQTQREKDLQAANQRVEEAKQELEDAIKEEVKLNKF